jgi:hypothetical protein
LAEGISGMEKINNTGLYLDDLFGDMEVAMVMPGMSNNRAINKQVESIRVAGVDSGWIVTSIQTERDTLPKQIVFIPALILLSLIAMIQFRRKKYLSAQ